MEAVGGNTAILQEQDNVPFDHESPNLTTL
jgi:hypothetical protein